MIIIPIILWIIKFNPPIHYKYICCIFRDFLRLGSPLSCRPIDEMFDGPLHLDNSWCQNYPISRASSVEERKTPLEVEMKIKTAGDVVPLTRVKCLVSMTTPKDARINGAVVTPAFIEFDMSTEGFGCLYLPSIAPQGPPTPSVVSGVVGGTDSVVIGGIGTGKNTISVICKVWELVMNTSSSPGHKCLESYCHSHGGGIINVIVHRQKTLTLTLLFTHTNW